MSANSLTERGPQAPLAVRRFRWEMPLNKKGCLLIFDRLRGSEDRQAVAWVKTVDDAERIVAALNAAEARSC